MDGRGSRLEHAVGLLDFSHVHMRGNHGERTDCVISKNILRSIFRGKSALASWTRAHDYMTVIVFTDAFLMLLLEGGGGVFASGWTYTHIFTTYFIFTSNSKSFLDDTCLLTGRGKTVSLGRCSDFGQSLQLLQLVRQARQYLADKNPSGTQNMIVMETKVHFQRMMILPFLSLKPSSCQALLYNTIGVTLLYV